MMKYLNYIYKEFRLFATIVYDERIILSEMRAEILFDFTSRAMHGSFSLKFSKTDILFWIQRAKRPQLLRPMLVSELTEKTAGEKKEGERTPCYFGRGGGRGLWLPTRWFDPAQRGTSRWDFRPRYSRGNKITPALRPYIHNCRQPPTLRKRLRLESRN